MFYRQDQEKVDDLPVHVHIGVESLYWTNFLNTGLTLAI